MLFTQPLTDAVRKMAKSPLVFESVTSALSLQVREEARSETIFEPVMIRTYTHLFKIVSGVDLLMHHPENKSFPLYPNGVQFGLNQNVLTLTLTVQIRLRNLPKIHLEVIDQEMRDRDREIVVKLQEMANAINATLSL